MFTQYYELIDDSKLPPGSFYTEPRDLDTIYVKSGESLEKFSERVAKSREEKGYPVLSPNDLRFLVVASLERSTPRKELTKFFSPRAALPQFSQVASLAKVLVSQVGSNAAGYNQRVSRAFKCKACVLHKANNSISPKAQSTINKITEAISSSNSHDTLSELQYAEAEKGLGTCGMCGCGLPAKIRVNILGALASISPPQLDRLLGIYGAAAFDACWILSEGLGDANLRKILDAKLRNTRSNGTSLLSAYFKNKHLAAAAASNKKE